MAPPIPSLVPAGPLSLRPQREPMVYRDSCELVESLEGRLEQFHFPHLSWRSGRRLEIQQLVIRVGLLGDEGGAGQARQGG